MYYIHTMYSTKILKVTEKRTFIYSPKLDKVQNYAAFFFYFFCLIAHLDCYFNVCGILMT